MPGSFNFLYNKSFVAFILSVCLVPAEAGWVKQSLDVMGTKVSVELWHSDDSVAAKCSEQVFDEMHRIDALMSPYKSNSEITAINQNAAIEAVRVDTELYQLIKKSITFSEQSNGAFDITFASIGHRYDYRNKQHPSEQAIQTKLSSINFRNLILENQTVRFARPGMRIDLGGIAKGHAVDRSIAIVRKCGIEQALVTAGGDSRILGDKQGKPWIIGLQHPRKKNAIALRLPLTESAISTSGDYERFFVTNDERIHHIIDPQTGKSANKSWSVTVIGPDATSTDALSTTVFILGAEKGLQLIESLENMDAIIIDANGKVHYSSGLQDPAKSS